MSSEIVSLVAGAPGDANRALTILAADAATAAPVPADVGLPANNAGILTLMLRDDLGGVAWTQGTFIVWRREPALSDEWHAGPAFNWVIATDGYVLDYNIHGAERVWIQMTAKVGGVGPACSIWAGANTIEGA